MTFAHRFIIGTALGLLCLSPSLFAGEPAGVVTSFLAPAQANGLRTPEIYQLALREVFVEAGVDRQIKGATKNGRFRKRYLLKIAHNNGAGVDGFLVANIKEMPGFMWVVTKTLLDFFHEAMKGPLSPDERKILEEGTPVIHFLEAQTKDQESISPDSTSSTDMKTPETPKRVFGFRLVADATKLILKILAKCTRTEPWNVVGYPAVSNPQVVGAWAELIREWGGEPWVGDESGIESPNSLDNMKKSGIYSAVKDSGARLWIFNKGIVDFANSGADPVYITTLDGVPLNACQAVASPYLADYPDQQIRLPSAVVNGFFAGVFFEAHPKAHVLSTMTGGIKNLVGLMDKDSRHAMHNMAPGVSPWGIVKAHNTNSNKKIAETAYAVNRILGSEIMGYIGDSVSTITAIGPDTGPHTVFDPADQTITFSRNLFWQESATLAISMIAAQHVMAGHSRFPNLQFNRYFRSGNPLADEVYQYYRQMALQEDPSLTSFSWKFLRASPAEPLLSSLQDLRNTHLSPLKIDLRINGE